MVPNAASALRAAQANKLPSAAAPWVVRFKAADLAALSSRTYLLTLQPWKDMAKSHSRSNPKEQRIVIDEDKKDEDELALENQHVSVFFSQRTGRVSRLVRHLPEGDIETAMDVRMGYYESFGSPAQSGFKYGQSDARDPHQQNLNPLSAYADRETSTQPSGAYLFRPFPEHAEAKSTVNANANANETPELVLIKGRGFQEVRQTFSKWTQAAVRLYDDSPNVQVDWTVGPVPVDDQWGKEVVVEFNAKDIASGEDGANKWATDSNGREFMQRQLNYRPTWDLQVHEPVAGNFFPVTTAMYLKGPIAPANTNANTNANASAKQAQLSVLVDRAQAGASLQPGAMSFMVHRRLLADDYRGVGEALNETVGGMSPYPDWTRSGDGIVVSGRHTLLLSSGSDGMKELRAAMDEVYAPFDALYAPVGQSLEVGGGLGYDLPVNVHLMTLSNPASYFGPDSSSSSSSSANKDKDKEGDNTEFNLLVRLAHQFQVGEDTELSKPVAVDVSKLLSTYGKVQSIQDLTLSTNEDKAQQLKDKVIWDAASGPSTSESEKLRIIGSSSGEDLTVTLHPMQIRTLSVVLKK